MTTQILRRAGLVAAAATAAVVGSAVVAGPASADVPSGWPEYSGFSAGHLLIIILVVPVIAALVISLLVLLPGIFRGEGLVPRAPKGDPQPPADGGH